MAKQGKQSILAAARTAKTKDTAARAKRTNGQRLAATGDSYQNLIAQLGIGVDPTLSSSRYGFNPLTRNRIELEWIHRGSWLGGIGCDIPAEDMTREGATMTGEVDPAAQQEALAYLGKVGFWEGVADDIRWARLYGGAIGVHLLDGQDPSTPLRYQAVRRDQYRGIMVLDRWMVQPSLNDLVTVYGPELGLPKFYDVNADAPAFRGQRIHHTRCIRLVGDKLPYYQRLTENLWGLSVFERIYDRMVLLDNGSTSAGQLINTAFLRTFGIKDLRDLIGSNGPAYDALLKQIQFMQTTQSNMGVTLMDTEDKFEGHTQSSFTGIADILIKFEECISGAWEIPLVRLLGQSPSGLNSNGESDLKMYYDGTRHKQVIQLTHGVLTGFRCALASVGAPIPADLGVEFTPLWQLSPTDKANVAEVTTRTVQAAEESGLISPKTALMELKQSSDVTGIFSNISSEDIDAAADVAAPPPMEAGAGLGDPGTGEEPQGVTGEHPAGLPAGGQKGASTSDPDGEAAPSAASQREGE